MAITSAICNSFKQEILEAEHNFTASTGNTFNLGQILISALTSFITALLSIKFMMRLVKKSTYNFFVIYRIILGIIILAWVYI